MTDKPFSDEAFSQRFSYSISLGVNPMCLKVVAKGFGKPDDVLAMYEDIRQHIKQDNLSNLLLDVKSLTLSYSGSDVVRVLHSLETTLRALNVARIVDLSDYKSDLIELFASDHNISLKSFISEQDALAWLRAQSQV